MSDMNFNFEGDDFDFGGGEDDFFLKLDDDPELNIDEDQLEEAKIQQEFVSTYQDEQRTSSGLIIEGNSKLAKANRSAAYANRNPESIFAEKMAIALKKMETSKYISEDSYKKFLNEVTSELQLILSSLDSQTLLNLNAGTIFLAYQIMNSTSKYDKAKRRVDIQKSFNKIARNTNSFFKENKIYPEDILRYCRFIYYSFNIGEPFWDFT